MVAPHLPGFSGSLEDNPLHLSFRNFTGFLLSCTSKYKACCLCFKVMTASTPFGSSSSVRTICHPSCDTRSFKGNRYNRKQHGFHSFSGSGPQVWDEQPYCLTLSDTATLSSFKSNLKTIPFPTFLTIQLLKFYITLVLHSVITTSSFSSCPLPFPHLTPCVFVHVCVCFE